MKTNEKIYWKDNQWLSNRCTWCDIINTRKARMILIMSNDCYHWAEMQYLHATTESSMNNVWFTCFSFSRKQKEILMSTRKKCASDENCTLFQFVEHVLLIRPSTIDFYSHQFDLIVWIFTSYFCRSNRSVNS